MPRIVVIGGGIAGCASALSSAKAGAEVILIERIDALTGAAWQAGLYKGNGRFTAEAELTFMGGGDILNALDDITIHKFDLPGEPVEMHVSVYDIFKIESKIEELLLNAGVNIMYLSRAKDVKLKDKKIEAVLLDNRKKIEGDIFIETTGFMGTMEQCKKYGFGCCFCYMRCPTFGSRVSIAKKAGMNEIIRRRADGTPGTVNASFSLAKESLAPHIVKELERNGYLLVPIPKEIVNYEKFNSIGASQNVIKEFMDNLCIVDNGYAKVRVQLYMPLKDLHRIPGFEYARMVDPLSGGVGNAVDGFDITITDKYLRVIGLENLFAAGSKADYTGITGGIVSGVVAGYNATRKALGLNLLDIPRTLVLGDFFAYSTENRDIEGGLRKKIKLRSGGYFQRMKDLGLYTTDLEEIKNRVEKENLLNIFSKRLN